MKNKVLKITLTAIYKDDSITIDEISDNIWEAMKTINDNLIMMNIDDVKEMKNTKSAIKKALENMIEAENPQISQKEDCIVIDKKIDE